MVDCKDLRTVRQLADEIKFATANQLRCWIQNADKNGLKPALIKIQGRLFIDLREFNKWIDSRRMAPKAA